MTYAAARDGSDLLGHLTHGLHRGLEIYRLQRQTEVAVGDKMYSEACEACGNNVSYT